MAGDAPTLKYETRASLAASTQNKTPRASPPFHALQQPFHAGLLVEGGSPEHRSAWHIPPGAEAEVIRVSFTAEMPGEFKVWYGSEVALLRGSFGAWRCFMLSLLLLFLFFEHTSFFRTPLFFSRTPFFFSRTPFFLSNTLFFVEHPSFCHDGAKGENAHVERWKGFTSTSFLREP